MSEHDDLIREALAAERAAAYAQLDPDEFEELIAATDAALEARPSLVAESREALIATLMSQQHAPMSDHDPRDGSCRSCPWPLHELGPEEIADALLAPGGPVRVADATPEQAWDECVAAAKRVKPWSHVPANPYDGFTRKEQNDDE